MNRPDARRAVIAIAVCAVATLAAALALVANASAAGASASTSTDDPLPTVTSVSPGTTDWLSGDTITITGAGFSSPTRVDVVDVDAGGYEARATHITVQSSTQLSFPLPVLYPSNVEFQVKTTAGRSTLTHETQLELTNAPSSPWQASTAPVPSNSLAPRDQILEQVSCSDSTHCAAWGGYLAQGGHFTDALDTLAGSTWTTVHLPAPADVGQGKVRVLTGPASCGTAGLCVVAGEYRRAHLGLRAFVERLADNTWHPDEIPVPAGKPAGDETAAYGSSCVAAKCVVVGDVDKRPSISVLTDGVWTTRFAPLPTGATGSGHLYSVSCPTDTYCQAVGLYHDANGRIGYLVDTLSDGAWTAGTLPLPSGASAKQMYVHRIAAVSCGAVGFCAAVGEYKASPQGGRPLLERLDGSTWTARQAPITSGAVAPNNFLLPSVSCAPSQTCVAAQHSNGGTNVETLDAGSWTATPIAVPDDTPVKHVVPSAQASCFAAGECVLGESVSVANSYASIPAVATYVDGTWSSQRISAASSTDAQTSMGTSWCGTDGSCVLVGGSGPLFQGDTGEQYLVETRNATNLN